MTLRFAPGGTASFGTQRNKPGRLPVSSQRQKRCAFVTQNSHGGVSSIRDGALAPFLREI